MEPTGTIALTVLCLPAVLSPLRRPVLILKV
jgi:hypothetical protein